MSRKLVANLFYSVDGVAADPFNFQHDSFDKSLAAFMNEGIQQIDANVLGRVTYQEWASYWPSITEGENAGFAEFINSTPKHIASSTLGADEITWAGARLIQGEMTDFIRELVEQEGGTIAVQGSLSVVRQCVEAGLMDELTLIIHPAVAGKGRGLFNGMEPTRLRLIDAKPTEKGNILATYGPNRH
ncbi:dihydrofolate reductase family protein [Micrococcus luteus]|nr:dihydrofolate reductase family protein [Micrococcus luteus]